MSIVELNSVAQDLISVRSMIKELEAEAEALTDKLKAAMVEQGTESFRGTAGKPAGRTSTAAGLTARHSRLTTLTCTASTARAP